MSAKGKPSASRPQSLIGEQKIPMNKYNDVVQKLAKLPIWNDADRCELCSRHHEEIKFVLNLFSPEERKALAHELPAWARSFDGETLQRPPMDAGLHVLVQRVVRDTLEKHMIGLFLLIMDEKDGKQIKPWRKQSENDAAIHPSRKTDGAKLTKAK